MGQAPPLDGMTSVYRVSVVADTMMKDGDSSNITSHQARVSQRLVCNDWNVVDSDTSTASCFMVRMCAMTPSLGPQGPSAEHAVAFDGCRGHASYGWPLSLQVVLRSAMGCCRIALSKERSLDFQRQLWTFGDNVPQVRP